MDTPNQALKPTMLPKYLFSTFDVTRQVFFRSKLSLGIVNLKPLLPGHILILPRRVVPRLADLQSDEIADLFGSVQSIGKVLERVFKAEALTISLQDGLAAGQSVPHVHIHIIPRRTADYANNDEIYPAIERAEQRLDSDLTAASGHANGGRVVERPTMHELVPRDEDRKPRTEREMEEEANWIHAAMVNAGVDMEVD